MLRHTRYIAVILLLTTVMMYSDAHVLQSDISAGRLVKHADGAETRFFPRFFTGLTVETAFAFVPGSFRSVLSLSPDDIKKARVNALYKTHGFNSAVESRLHYYEKYKGELLKPLRRAGKYLEKMSDIFREKDLPEELIFLPLIESGFRLHVYSPKRAAGPWQFMPSTARNYGLKIDWWVDERKDPVKSTRAAAEYLRDLYDVFGSWNLVLAAYNAGEGKILRAVRKAKSDDFWVLRKTRYIKAETKNYVPSYIAATAIALDPEGFGLKNVAYHNPLKYDEVIVALPIDLETAAEFTNSSFKEIKELNPELRRWCTPPNVSNYTLKIPAGTKRMFHYNLSNAENEEIFYVKLYTVKTGDTVNKIASRFGVPARAVIDVNALNSEALIISGSKILIPSGRDTVTGARHEMPGSIKPILMKRSDQKSRSKPSIWDF